jgi:hypothetical protein
LIRGRKRLNRKAVFKQQGTFMSADISRQRFDPANDYAGVLMQQGRVQLDADWNELVELFDRRFRTETIDIIGRAVVPKETPEGFKITLTAGKLAMGPGRIYVHGLLAENHGTAPVSFDPILAERRGAGTVVYDQQPYFPAPPALPGGPGPHLAYLDVWQREVTYIEERDLVENAVGVDTTTRMQTVWQVKVLPNVGAGITCATPDANIPGWLAEITPSAGRLTTSALGVAPADDPCLIPPSGGYRGLDNRTYRVEIHDPAKPGKPATFKWSRDNGSVVTAVNTINAARDTLGVVRTQRDDILRFSTGDWVEITDDNRELNGLPGEIRKITDVNHDTKTIKLATPLPAGLFPTGPQVKVDPARHTRVRRWDQKGFVRDSNGNTLLDLDAPASAGVIPIPGPGVTVLLEDGVAVSFSLDPVVGNFRVANYWIFVARTADASVEILTQAPPCGIHHHYARLAVITFPTTVVDCRTFWPPPFGGGKSCDCTVCVSPEDQNSGALTIQGAIDKVISAGGGKVCLEAGLYQLGRSPLQILGAKSVRLVGKGRQTILLSSSPTVAIVVDRCNDVVLEEFSLRFPPGQDTLKTETGAIAGLFLHNSQRIRVQACVLQQLDQGPTGGLAVALSGILKEVALRDNLLAANVGIAGITLDSFDPTPRLTIVGASEYLRSQQLLIQDNALACSQAGIRLDGQTFLAGETRIAGNVLRGCAVAGIVAVGLVEAGGHVDVVDNELSVTGDGIRAGADQIAILRNVITGVANADGPLGTGNGIALVRSPDPKASLRVQVLSNAVANVGGHGIVLATSLLAAMIKQNRIENVNGGGIVMDSTASADTLSIANNQISSVGLRGNQAKLPLAGILVFRTRHVDVADNSVRAVGLQAPAAPAHFGIYLLGCGTVNVAGNEVTDVGPEGEFKSPKVGIRVDATFEHVEIVANIVQRSPRVEGARPVAAALVIRAATDLVELAGLGFVAGDNLTAGFFGMTLVKLPRGLENVSVRGNRLAGYGTKQALVATVLIDAHGQCLFHDNHVLREIS